MTNPAKPQTAAGEKTRERILEAALDLFSVEGFDGTTTRAIADRAGVNLGLIKYYFGSKDLLWKASVDAVFEELWEALGDAPPLDGGDENPDYEALLRGVIRFVSQHPQLIRLMNDEGKRGGPRMDWLTETHGRRLFGTVTGMVARLESEGLFPKAPPANAFFALIGSAGLFFSQAPECMALAGVDPGTEAAAEAHADLIVDMILRR